MGYSLKYRKLRALEERRYADYDYINRQSKRKEITWQSITPNIPGTVPEKMVYDYLVQLGINFEFQYALADAADTYMNENRWIPDFTLPDYDVIIEIFGIYWHSIPETEEGDKLKAMYMLNEGYTRYANGIPTYPTGGYQGKRLIVWSDSEIYVMGPPVLFARDLPDIIFNPLKRGVPAEYLQNKDVEFLKKEKAKAAQSMRMTLPKITKRSLSLIVKSRRNVGKVSAKLHPGSKARAL